MSENPIRVFITGACAGLAEVRQALSAHPEIEIVGTAVEPAKAAQKLAGSNAQVIMHGSSRGDRLPLEDVEAIRQATAAPIILVTSGSANGLLQEALQHGVQDVVLLPQLTDALVFTIRRAFVMSVTHTRAVDAAAPRRGSDGKIVTIFSPKGGVGKTMLATGLATVYARAARKRTLLIDLDLQFGDCAILMGVEPVKTIYDLVMTSGELDPEKLAGYVTSHPSGVDVVPAPVRPEDAELVAEDRVAHLLQIAKEAYDVIVVDTPSHFHAATLATLDRTDRLVLVASLDIPTVKNVKLTLQTLNLLHYPKDKVSLVLNRPQSRSELKPADVERALDMKIVADIPCDREVPVAVNRGVPVPMSASRSAVTKSLTELGAALLPERRTGKKGDKAAPAPTMPDEPTGGGKPRFGLRKPALKKAA
jgi:pilus assembly protein CpaE